MPRLYLIRHARPAAAWGDADEDPGLDEVGRGKARAVAERLLALPADVRPRAVVSSPLQRCRQTAAPFAEALGVAPLIDPAVGEIPTPRGLGAAARPAWLGKSMAGRWGEIEGDLDYAEWRASVVAALLDHAGAAVFSHFVAINALVSSLVGEDKVVVFRPDHVSVTTLDVEAGRLRLIERGAEAATRVV